MPSASRASDGMVLGTTTVGSGGRASSSRRTGKLLDVARDSGLALVFECRQGFQDFTGSGTVENQVVLANSPISEDEHTLRELCDVALVSDQHDR